MSKYLYKDKKFVGFCGYKRCGKGTAAEAIKEMGFVDVPFAGGLKAMLTAWLEYNGVEQPELYTDDWMKDHRSRYFNNKEFRYAMQTLGTEWGRNMIGSNFWIDGWERKIANHDLVCVSDVRFPDEVDAVRSKGGIIIKIHRPSFHNLDNHESEARMTTLRADYEVVNSSIKSFQNDIKKIVTKHFEERDNRNGK